MNIHIYLGPIFLSPRLFWSKSFFTYFFRKSQDRPASASIFTHILQPVTLYIVADEPNQPWLFNHRSGHLVPSWTYMIGSATPW